jgi:hypothetical protein
MNANKKPCKGYECPPEDGWTPLEAVLALGSLGALGAGFAMYGGGGDPCTASMSDAACQAAHQKRDIAVTAMVIGGLTGLLLITEKSARALTPART